MAQRGDIEELFSGSFKEFEAPVPEVAWDNIQAQLATKKKGMVVWWKWGVAASVLVGATFITVKTLNTTEQPQAYIERTETPQLSDENSGIKLSDASTGTVAENEDGSDNSSNAAANDGVVPPSNAKDQIRPNEPARALAAETKDKPKNGEGENDQDRLNTVSPVENIKPGSEQIVEDKPSQEQKPQDSKHQAPQTQKSTEEILSELEEPMPPLPDDKPKKNQADDGNWLLAANMQSGATGGNLASEQTFTSLNAPVALNNVPESEDGSVTTNSFQSRNAIEENLEYLPPVLFGLQVGKPLGGNWATDFGLSYSMIGSKSSYTDGTGTTNRLHYLGFPLNLRRDFNRDKNVGFFLSGGYLPEKALGGSIKSNQTSASVHIAARGWQHSLNLGAGITAKINDLFVLYALPAYSLYFKPHDNYYNFRREQVGWPSVLVGLRLNLK